MHFVLNMQLKPRQRSQEKVVLEGWITFEARHEDQSFYGRTFQIRLKVPKYPEEIPPEIEVRCGHDLFFAYKGVMDKPLIEKLSEEDRMKFGFFLGHCKQVRMDGTCRREYEVSSLQPELQEFYYQLCGRELNS